MASSNPIKHGPKQKHTAKLLAFKFSNLIEGESSLWWRELRAVRACKMRAGKQTRSILSGETRRSSHRAARGSLLWVKALAPAGYAIISLKVFERRTACHFTQANVQKGMKPKQTRLPSLRGTDSQIRSEGADVPSCLCRIKGG